jgi:hypothetical protein
MRPAILILLPAGIWAQSLQILPSPPSQAETSFRIMLASPEAKAPVALQWDLLLPEGVTLKDTIAGEAAEAAQKSIKCSAIPTRDKAGNGSEFRCLVIGGQKPLPDGAVALVQCGLRQGLREATVRVRHAMGVSRDLKQIYIGDVQGTITGQ